MSNFSQSAYDIRCADLEEEIAACYPLMCQLRPHLASEREFIARCNNQKTAGYRLIALWQGGVPVALAGFRLQENLFHGVHFYVDDLVTDANARSSGYGRAMIEWLKAEGRKSSCSKLVLDTPLTNVLGHRFYFRHGLLARALRFSIDLADVV